MYTDKLIQGERALNEFLAKFRPGLKIAWCETIGHIADVTIEMFYERSPQDEYYKQWFWLYMDCEPGRKGAFYNISDRRHEIYESIRAGRITAK